MRKFFYIISCSFALLACYEGSINKTGKSEGISSQMDSQSEIKHPDTVYQITNTALDSINVVALKEDYSKGAIQLYNQDGTIWKTFEVTDDFSDNSIVPSAIKPEDRIMVFIVVGRKNNLYSIIVNEDKNIVKYIKPNNPYFNYETWQQHIIKAFSVDFSPTTNPIKAEPSNTEKTLPFDKEQFYHPVEVKGDWLKVKDDDDREGWIKWRNAKGELLVQIYYEA